MAAPKKSPPKTHNGKNANFVRKHAFKKGDPKPPTAGRRKGQPNRTTTLLKDAILRAAELVGQDGRGKNGLTGYLMMLAVREKAVYARLLEKVLPLQLHVADKTDRKYSPAEAAQRLRERNIPVPTSLLALAGPSMVAHALNDQHEDGVTDHYDNRLRSIAEDYAAELSERDEEEDEE
jgi:hypothetical protein